MHSAYRNIVSLADAELIGRKFIDEKANMQLDLKESFYDGDAVDEIKAIRLLKSASLDDATFNIVGERSVDAALKAGIIDKKGIIRIKGIPHALGLI